jgi:hypothetical protein
VAKTDTDLAGLIRRSLDAVGRTEGTVLTAFTDGCPGLRRILLDAGIERLPILDWFHVAMRLQHLTQIAGGLLSDGPERAAAKAVIVEEVERLRWRLWNGSPAAADPSRPRASCGLRCRRWTATSSGKAIGWSTTANGTGPGCGLARR